MIGASITKETRKDIYRREGYQCAVCGSNRQLEIHHVIKRSRGGSNNPQNLVCLCHLCHCQVHGERVRPVALDDFPLSAEDTEQAIVEYLADLYAERYGECWWPWTDAVPTSPAERDRRRHNRWPRLFVEWWEQGGL